MKNQPVDAFVEELRRARSERGVSQADVDQAIGKARGFIGQIEACNIKPPPENLTRQIARFLEQDEDRFWVLAAEARMYWFDKDLWLHHRRMVAAASGSDASPTEQQFLREFREFLAVRDSDDWTELIDDMGWDIAGLLGAEAAFERAYDESVSPLPDVFSGLMALPFHVRGMALSLFSALLNAGELDVRVVAAVLDRVHVARTKGEDAEKGPPLTPEHLLLIEGARMFMEEPDGP